MFISRGTIEFIMTLGLAPGDVGELIGRVLADELESHKPQARKLYQREPRTKAYGPATRPNLYWCDEKARALDYAAQFSPTGEITNRLRDSDWWPLVGQTMRRCEYRCTYCGADQESYALHCDHIVALARGGTNDPDNLTIACDYCNCSKRDKPLHEWLGDLS